MSIMSNCSHVGWLRVWKQCDRIILEATDRPRRLLREIQNIDKPAGFVVLIGNQTKAITNFVPKVRANYRKSHGEYDLRVSHVSERSIIICDGDIPSHNRLPRSCILRPCHETITEQLMHGVEADKAVEASDCIYHRVISPLADVVCIFVADVGGIDSAVRRLEAWASRGRSSTCLIRPALILVVAREQKRDMQNAIDSALLGDSFQHIRIVAISLLSRKLRSRNVATRPTKCWALQKAVFKSLDLVQRGKLNLGLQFSVRHTVEFLVNASDAAVASQWKPLDFIQISRAKTPISAELSTHLMAFLKYMANSPSFKQFTIPHIASSLILDQYPPGMHSFNPHDVFDSLYIHICKQARTDLDAYRQLSGLSELSFDIVRLIELEMSEQYRRYEELGSSRELHQQNLIHLRTRGSFPTSGETCFGCLQHKPQRRLPCKHWICETCIRIFYTPSPDNPWLYRVDQCILCGVDTGDFRIRVKPDTATTRVLSIDGGGTRGRAPLEFLQILQQSIGLPYPVQQNFDVVYGTSSGAMTACALFINNWPIEKCIEYFEQSSKLAFEKRRLFRLFGSIPILSPAFEFVVSLLVDSKYSAKKLEKIQREVYGPYSSVVECRETNEISAFIGLTLTSIDDTSTFVVTNYGEAGESRESSQYSILKPSTGICDVPLWEILRCCTAAPYYFTPHRIDGVGVFQDGGLTFNNPTCIAIKEAAALFPESPEPSIVVSLGTGSNQPSPCYELESQPMWKDSFVARLSRALLKHSDSNNPEDICGGRYFRFDVDFKSKKPPALDDVGSLAEVARMVREVTLGSTAMKHLSKCIRAEQFLFELDPSRPQVLLNGVYKCVGYIICRLRAGTVEFEAFMSQLHHSFASFQFQGRKVLGDFQGSIGKRSHKNFRQEITFHIPPTGRQFEICMQEGNLNENYHISGSPFSLDWLIARQKLDACFGSKDHRKRTAINYGIMPLRKRQKFCS